MKFFPVLLSLVLLACRPAARADDYQGADTILEQIETAQSKEAGAPRKSASLGQFHADAKNLRANAATLTPDAAARAWLALFDRASKLSTAPDEQYFGRNTSPRLEEIFEALPPPADWDALTAQIMARPLPAKDSAATATPVLRVVAAMLQNDHDAARQAIDALQQQEEMSPDRKGSHPSVQGLWDAFYNLVGDRATVLKNFEAKLSPPKSARLTSAAVADGVGGWDRSSTLEIPNLMALTDAANAESLLRKAFALDLSDVSVSDDKTAALARKVALSMGDALKFAPWKLVNSLDATELYEMLAKRFPGKSSGGRESDRQKADAYYLLGLIVQGRSEDAVAQALKLGGPLGSNDNDALSELPETALADLTSKGYAKEVYEFFNRLLKDHPELPYWRSYTSSAVLAGETDAMLAAVKAASERADLKPVTKDALRNAYGDALLAADHVAEALPILRELTASSKRVIVSRYSRGDNDLQAQATGAARLAGIAQLLGDETLLNEQLDAIAKMAKSQPNIVQRTYVPDGDLDDLFLAANRGPELERLLAANLLQDVSAAVRRRTQQNGRSPTYYDEHASQPIRESLNALVNLYCRLDRYTDVTALLDHAPYWGAEDVAQLLKKPVYYSSSARRFGYQAALALHKTGHDDAALRAVNAFLADYGGHDPAYALLLELLPADQAEARLNDLFRADQFEERPLIWRAKLQLDQGRLDDAEKSARQAIGIDPSDGEEGRGDRMRAYAVLGDILERKGDPDKAAQMRRAVQAIRLSEDADRCHAAGLFTRAVDQYKKALGYFADAYCIQSRLAIQLVALGKMDEAMTHYERAYELMPDSFGRMESHCFGCEHAFAGERAQGVAERVFDQLVAKQPDNPRVHYLLGYLRGQQDRDAEAASEYRDAVRLDPDYINAWKQLASTTDDPADRDRAALNLLRLDPRRRHDSADLTRVGDLRALWPAVEAARKFTPPEPVDFYPLAASKAALEEEPRHPAPGDASDARTRTVYHRSDEPFAPGTVVARNKVIAQALQFLPKSNGGDDGPSL